MRGVRVHLPVDVAAALLRFEDQLNGSRAHRVHASDDIGVGMSYAARIAIVEGLAELAHGAPLDAPSRPNTETLNVRAAAWLWSECEEVAGAHGVRRAEVIRRALELGLARNV